MERRTDLERAEGSGFQWEISRGQDGPDPASDQQAREERVWDPVLLGAFRWSLLHSTSQFLSS